jgi:hypothetical protein
LPELEDLLHRNVREMPHLSPSGVGEIAADLVLEAVVVVISDPGRAVLLVVRNQVLEERAHGFDGGRVRGVAEGRCR